MTRSARAVLGAMSLAVVVAGCASTRGASPGGAAPLSEPAPSRPDERSQAEADDQAARRAEAELTAARVDGAPPSCERACGLQATICELAGRICAIAGRNPDDPALAARCNDGRARCVRARDAVAARCACGPATRAP